MSSNNGQNNCEVKKRGSITKVHDNNSIASSPTSVKASDKHCPNTNFNSTSMLSLSSKPRTSSFSRTDSQFNMWKLERDSEKKDRAGLVLWRSPIKTLHYFLVELGYKLVEGVYEIKQHAKLVQGLVALVIVTLLVCSLDGPHNSYVTSALNFGQLCGYWIFLGILSSIGLGTGLHTFILYLGPFIAQVTMAAFECHSVNFPEPPFPNTILCPEVSDDTINVEKAGSYVVFWRIMRKVNVESFMWGFGTALGELPPYFMARFARLSGQDPDDEEFDEVEMLLHERNKPKSHFNVFQRAKLLMYDAAQKMGFLGILLCASIPNPLYDLAGITCGHFLIPFWTFFGATLIGKAVVKMHFQIIFVIVMFSQHYVDYFIDLVGKLPTYGARLQAPFQEFLEKQRLKMHNPLSTSSTVESQNMIQWLYGKLVICMILYFALSIINAFAQSYHKRMCKSMRESGMSITAAKVGTAKIC